MDNTLLEAFKQRMRINYDIDDDNLNEIVQRSYNVIKNNCGEFDVETNEFGRFLVLEHARYTFNDDVEFFMENFREDLASFAFTLKKKEWLDEQSETNI